MRRTAAFAYRLAGVMPLAMTVIVGPLLLRRLLGGPTTLVEGLRSVNWGRVDGTDSRVVVIAGLGALLWLTWARIAVATTLTMTCRLLRCRVPRIPLLGASQTLVALALGGAVVTGTAPSSTPVGPAPAHGRPGGVVALSLQQNGVQVGWTEAGFLAAGIATALGATRWRQHHRPRHRSPGMPTSSPQTSTPQTSTPPRLVGEPDELQVVKQLLEPEPSPAVPPLPRWRFMVRLLGPVDVLADDGQPVVFERAKAIELLAWLTLHRRSATREAARAALWEADVRDTSFANVVSALRRTLATHASSDCDAEWVERPRGERLGLHPEVVSDVDLFQAHVARAKHFASIGGPLSDVASELSSALTLVRGAPFIGSGFGWADSEATTSGLTLLVVSTAVDLTERALSSERLDEVFWATSIGLSVLPGHEELVALRLRAHARAGDGAGVRHEWNTYVRSLLGDPWQTEPSPWLTELVRELLADSVTA